VPRYRVTHRESKAFTVIEAPTAQDACQICGWMIGDCHVQPAAEQPFSYPQRPEELVDIRVLHTMQTALALARQALRNIRLLTSPEPLSLDTARRLLRRIHQLAGGTENKT
jgi:hypothetical protein